MKQLNSNNTLVEKDENGAEMMGFTEEGRKKLIYGPKIQLQKEFGMEDDNNANM